MNDPLSLVRQATISGEPVKYADQHYTFGNQRFHESTKTAFKRTLRSDEYFYSLRDVIFFLENAHLTLAEYRRKAVENKISAIVEQDRMPLQKYLTGEQESAPQIDINLQNSYKAAVPAKPVSILKKAASEHAAPVEKAESAMAAVSVPEKEHKDRKPSKRKAHHMEADLSQTAHNIFTQALQSVPSVNKETMDQDRQVLAKLRAGEYAPFTRHTVLLAQGVDFNMAIKLFNDRVLKAINQPAEAAAAAAAAAQAASIQQASTGPRSQIIIVPNAMTSLLNMYNASSFFSKQQYITVAAAQAAALAAAQASAAAHGTAVEVPGKPKSVTFMRRVGDVQYPFKVIDDVRGLADDDWSRVVAVFVTGQLWQLKGYKWANPTELLQHVQGFHLMSEGATVDPTIFSWNCRVLKVNQFKEHVNASAVKDFWVALDDFIKVKKPTLVVK